MKSGLKRELTLLDVFSIAAGAMISSGLFVLPAMAYSKAGPAVVFSYGIAGLLILPVMFAMAELATAMPKAGGSYFFIERSMGAPLGTIGGLASWFSLSAKSAFALIGIGIFATLIKPDIAQADIKLISVGCCVFFMLVNIVGVKHSGRLQVWLVFFLLGILVFYVIRGSQFISMTRYEPFMPRGLKSVFATAGFVFVSFGGLTKICSVAEEVKDPGKNIPLGMLLAFCVVMLIYTTVVFITMGLLDAEALLRSVTPISHGAAVFGGAPASAILAVAALFAFATTGNAGIMTASRDAMAMSRDLLLPKVFRRVGKKTGTPIFSIVFTTFFMAAVILFLSLENLIKLASTLMLVLFIFVNLSLIVMRESRIQSYRPQFKAPLYPWLNLIGIAGCGFLIFEMGRAPLTLTGIFVLGALMWYFIYASSKVSRQAALVHVIERLTARELTAVTLPEELKDILKERDRIVEDRFDRLINDCKILDLKGPLMMEDFFRKAADALYAEFNAYPETIFNLLLSREKDSSTVIRPGLAIPHIIVKGQSRFKILLARCKEGIVFPAAEEKVHVVFVLAGTKDERNFHLRALAAIAEIAQAADFDSKWRRARDTQELRDIILLAERKRFTE